MKFKQPNYWNDQPTVSSVSDLVNDAVDSDCSGALENLKFKHNRLKDLFSNLLEVLVDKHFITVKELGTVLGRGDELKPIDE